jgi:hypothetical protein
MSYEDARKMYLSPGAGTKDADNTKLQFGHLPVNLALMTLILICIFIAIFVVTRKKHG